MALSPPQPQGANVMLAEEAERSERCLHWSPTAESGWLQPTGCPHQQAKAVDDQQARLEGPYDMAGRSAQATEVLDE